MAYIFMDESGDLGFNFRKKKTSKFFMITFLFVRDKRPIEKIVSKVLKGLPPPHRKHHPGILHAHKELPATRLHVLHLLNARAVSILSIYLNKLKVYTRLQDEKQVLYNYVTNILLDRVYTKKLVPLDQPIHLVASRRETNKFLNENFKRYLTAQLGAVHKLDIEILVRTPREEKCLQVTDVVSWALFRRRENNDESYWNVIKGKVLEESSLFP